MNFHLVFNGRYKIIQLHYFYRINLNTDFKSMLEFLPTSIFKIKRIQGYSK
ncbi:unnamed protein product [Tenebrio molitor]|nr:unnamed protein product [Tenebrio molitor]